MKYRFYSSVLYRIWKKFLTWFGDLYFATEPPKVKAVHLRKLMKIVKPGDVCCRRYNYYADSYFIQGAYSHSGICISEDTMIHAIAEGVGEIDILDFTKDTDGFIVLRPNYKSEEDLNKAIEFAIANKGKPYDFIFKKKDVNHFYCHELTWDSLLEGGIDIIPKENIIYADDLIGSCPTIYEPLPKK